MLNENIYIFGRHIKKFTVRVYIKIYIDFHKILYIILYYKIKLIFFVAVLSVYIQQKKKEQNCL